MSLPTPPPPRRPGAAGRWLLALVMLVGTVAGCTAPIDRDLTAKTLEVWIELETLTQRGGGAISLQSLDGTTFDAIVFGEREPRRWMAGSNNFARTQSFEGPEESEADSRSTHIAITWHADGTITGYRNGQPYGKPYASSGSVTFRKGEAQVLFGIMRKLAARGISIIYISHRMVEIFENCDRVSVFRDGR